MSCNYNSCNNYCTDKYPKQLIFEAVLNGQNEVPPNNSTATGTLIGILSLKKGNFRFLLHTLGLTNITSAHFHDAPVGQNGPVVKNINIDTTSGRAEGNWHVCDFHQPLTDEFICKLQNGLIYINIHTLARPDGEIRGQLRLVC